MHIINESPILRKLSGDVMVLLRAVGAAEYSKENLEEFCLKNGLRHRAICEIRKLRVQLTNQINLNIPGLNLIVDPMLKPPTDMEVILFFMFNFIHTNMWTTKKWRI